MGRNPKLSLKNMLFNQKKEDAKLVEHIQSPSLKERIIAEDKIFEKFKFLIKVCIRNHKVGPEDAYEIYSMTIHAVIDNIRNSAFRGDSPLKTYLYQIFLNKIADFTRKKTTKRRDWLMYMPEMQQLTHETASILSNIIKEEEYSHLKKAVTLLGEECKKILTMWSQNHTHEDIFNEMKYDKIKTVDDRIRSCKAKLRKLYNPDKK